MISDTVIQEIYTYLMSDSQNADILYKNIKHEFQYSKNELQKLIYNVALNVNGSIFPEITQLELFLTNKCQLACSYCFEKKMHSQKDMQLPTAYRAIDLLFDYSQLASNLEITFFGGEPPLRYNVIKKISEYTEKKALENGKIVDFNMTTNGLALNQKMVDFFHDHNIKILLSIDGLEKTHDSVRIDKCGAGTFQRVINALGLLKRKQLWIGAKITVIPRNVPTLYDDIKGLYDLGINQFIIGYATGMQWSVNEMNSYCDQMKKIFNWYKTKPRDNLRIADFDTIIRHNRFGCRAGNSCIAVSTDGEISACSKLLALNDNQLIARLGDVRYGLTCINNRINLVGCEKLKSSCTTLGIAADYDGGCFVENYEENTDPYLPSISNYEFTKRIHSIVTD